MTRSGTAIRYHLAHRPETREGLVLGTTDLGVDHFVLAAAMPVQHTLYNDHRAGTGRRLQDVTVALDVLDSAADLVTHRHLHVPDAWVSLPVTVGLALADPRPWRSLPDVGLELDITVARPDASPLVPRSARFDLDVRVAGDVCGAGQVDVAFATPGVAASMVHRLDEQCAAWAAELDADPTWTPVDPSSVGRTRAENVLVSTRAEPPWDGPVGSEDLLVRLPQTQWGERATMSARTLMEATRQAALYTAVWHAGVDPGRGAVSSWQASLRSAAIARRPLRCRTRIRPSTSLLHDLRTVTVDCELAQGDQIVGGVQVDLVSAV